MSQEKRPGGLTALAVINFVLCGLGVLGLLGMVAFFAMADMVPKEGMDENARAQIEAMKEMGVGMLIFLMAISLVAYVLLLLSGIGYLQQKRVMGRVLGNAYAVFSIGSGVVSALVLAPELGGGFTLGSLIGFVYPVLTLVLVNTVFRDDLVQ